MSEHNTAHFDEELLRFYETTADNVCGVGFGFKIVNGQTQSTPSIVFYVRKKKPVAEIAPQELLPPTLTINDTEYQTDVIEMPEGSVGFLNACFNVYDESNPEITRLRGFPAALVPMRGGQEIVMCPEGANAYGGVATGTLGFFAIDALDNETIVGVTNTHVVVFNQNFAGDITRPADQELLDIQNIVEPKYWARDGQKYPPSALIQNDGVSFHPAVLGVKRYVPHYSQEQVNENNTLVNRVDAALLIMNPGKFGSTNNYFVDETSFTVRRPIDIETLENNPALMPPYLPFASRAEMDDMFNKILTQGLIVHVRTTGARTGPKGYFEDCKLRLTQRILSSPGSVTAPGEKGFAPFRDIFRIEPVLPVGVSSGPASGYAAGRAGDSGSAIIADFTTVEDAKDVTQITHNGTAATATVSAHGYLNGDKIEITGATPTGFNGVYFITEVTTNTFKYVTTGLSSGATATGAITARRSKITPKIIGLLFAGPTSDDGSYALCCRIDNIADELSIRAWLPEDNFNRATSLKVQTPKIITRDRDIAGLAPAIVNADDGETYWHAGATIQGYPPLYEQGDTIVRLSNNTIVENNSVGQTVGQFLVLNSVSDFVVLDHYKFEFVSGTGDTDNASFSILNDQLRAAATFDADTKNTYSIRVRAINSAGVPSNPQILTVTINNIPDFQPSAISLSTNTISRGPAGRHVATISTATPSPTDVFSYFLVPGTGSNDNNQFAIANNSLFTAATMNIAGTKNIRIRAQNTGGQMAEANFTITVT